VVDPKRALTSVEGAVARARHLTAASRARVILGITGMPGAGKSTLAERVTDALGAAAVCVPMDGFHLAGSELARLGRGQRKGAPDTFDAAGYVALLGRLRSAAPGSAAVYAPRFDRGLEEPIAGAIAVPPEVPLVVTEGNYLLLDAEWAPVRDLLDEVWYVEVPEEVRLARLVRRHVAYGKSEDEARRWALGSDQANAGLIAATAHRADVTVRL
jgi:pantothenate kinase